MKNYSIKVKTKAVKDNEDLFISCKLSSNQNSLLHCHCKVDEKVSLNMYPNIDVTFVQYLNAYKFVYLNETGYFSKNIQSHGFKYMHKYIKDNNIIYSSTNHINVMTMCVFTHI